MESQAHLTLALDQGSISPFLRGANIVGHRDDLSCNAAVVSAAVRGTARLYGSERLRSVGKGGKSDVSLNRKDIVSPRFRIRLRCPRVGDSRPLTLIHLILYRSQFVSEAGKAEVTLTSTLL